MKILHYITDITSKDGLKNELILKMLSATAKSAECHLMTINTLSEEMHDMLRQEGVHVHYAKHACIKNPVRYFSAKTKIKKLLNSIEPELVHIHGAWDRTAAIVEKTSRMSYIATIISTHREFNLTTINEHFWKKKLLPLLTYQISMLRKCTCMLLIDDEEKKEVQTIIRKKRTEIISPNDDQSGNNDSKEDAKIDNKEEAKAEAKTYVNTDDFATRLIALYQKAIDSTYHLNITEEEKYFVQRMVVLSVTDKDKPFKAHSKKKRKEKAEEETPSLEDTLDTLSFRRISLYAYDEDVTTSMMEGVRKKNLSIPSFVDAENIDRYPNKKAKHRGPLEDLDIKPRKIRLPENMKEELKSTLLVYRAYKLKLNRLTLRHLVELYHMFRYTDFNEDIVGKELKYYGAKKFTKKLQKKMSEMFDMQNGYDIF